MLYFFVIYTVLITYCIHLMLRVYKLDNEIKETEKLKREEKQKHQMEELSKAMQQMKETKIKKIKF